MIFKDSEQQKSKKKRIKIDPKLKQKNDRKKHERKLDFGIEKPSKMRSKIKEKSM